MADFLARQPESYRKDFHPFEDESPEALQRLLVAADRDRFQAVRLGETLVAIFLLRGWDDGFERPSFGVMVDYQWCGNGLGGYCLTAALAECRANGIGSVMLKVAKGNSSAKVLYARFGFTEESICPDTGHQIMNLDLC